MSREAPAALQHTAAISVFILTHGTCLKYSSLMRTLTFPSSPWHRFNTPPTPIPSPQSPHPISGQQQLRPSGEPKKKEVGQEEERCVSASRMRGERREAWTDGGRMWRGGTARRTTEMRQSGRGEWWYHCSSWNNVNVEEAGDRCFVERDRRQRKIGRE